MSNTRIAADGVFRQERFCSAPEFEGETINGLAAVKRIAIEGDRQVREVLWFIQLRSLTPRGLRQLCDELISGFPDRVGTPMLRKLSTSKRRWKSAEILQLRRECGFEDDRSIAALGNREFNVIYDVPMDEWDAEFYLEHVRESIVSLPHVLMNFCLNPQSDIREGVWFFDDLFAALVGLRNRFIKAARSRLADTAITALIYDNLDFWYARNLAAFDRGGTKRIKVLIQGNAGIGRTVGARAWIDAHAGMVRFIEVPSSSDDRSFFASIARQLGVARGTSMKAQEIKVRVEEMLAASELMLCFDESQYLWGQYTRPRKTPDRLLWIKSILDAGTPVALVAHSDFSKWQAHYVKQTLWTDEQFERRLNRRVILPDQHSTEDMLKIARAHFPTGDQRSIKLLAAYALGTEKKQASGIVEALESATYRAEKDGRQQVTFADIQAALTEDHAFLSPSSAQDLHVTRNRISKPVQRRCSRGAGNNFSVLSGASGHRTNAPVQVTT